MWCYFIVNILGIFFVNTKIYEAANYVYIIGGKEQLLKGHLSKPHMDYIV